MYSYIRCCQSPYLCINFSLHPVCVFTYLKVLALSARTKRLSLLIRFARLHVYVRKQHMFGRAKYNFTCRTFEQYKLDKKESGLLSLILTAIIFRGRPSWRYPILGSFTLQGNTKISLLSIKVFTSTLFNSASFRKKNSFLINIVFLTFFICQVVKTNLDFLLKKTLNLRVRKDSVRTWHRTQYSSTKKVIRWIFYEETFIWWENHTGHIII